MQARVRCMLLVSSSLIAAAGNAQSVPQPTRPAQSNGQDELTPSNDIIVTARRRSETLLDVPQTINAVSSETIEKLRLNNAADLSQVVSGLSIEGGSSGSSGAFGASSSIRGVPTFLTSNASPVVQFYLNDAPTGRGPEVTQSLFDIGQVEVLKGPQGTLRGRSTPSGAITITSRRASVSQAGGYADISGTTRGAINAQGAVGVPLIRDVLAVRLAGVVDHNQGTGVKSANLDRDPFVESEAVRASVQFRPTDAITANVMYQKLWRSSNSFSQVVGLGNGVNGPAIAAGDRLGITDKPAYSKNNTNFLTGQLEVRLGRQKLNYVGSYRKGHSPAASVQDTANVVRGIEYFQTTDSRATEMSHELRLSSDERILGIFDYTIGGFYDREKSHNTVVGPARFLTGAFGAPGVAATAQQPLDRYTLNTNVLVEPVLTEKSLFGNVTAHLGTSTELSVGGRYLNIDRHDAFSLKLTNGFNALANPTRGALPCSALGALSPALAGSVASPVYAGACDLPIAGSTLQSVDRRTSYKPFIYNFALSRKFGEDLLVFANAGSAYRTAGPQVGLTSALTCCAGGPNLGSIENLVFQTPEKSRTYEIGLKSTFFNKRGRFNISLFHQDFDNFFFLTQSTRYLSVTDPTNPAGAGSTVSAAEFTAGADAKVNGIDLEAGGQITREWNINVNFTYSKAKLANAVVPCNDSNFDGTPDSGTPTVQSFINAGTLIARCKSNESISRSPRWNLTLQSEYAHHLTPGIDGFVRGNFTYNPKNPNASQTYTIDAYALVNLFLGIRAPNGSWELSAFSNNLTNTKKITAFNSVAPVSSASAISFFPQGVAGYNQIGFTPRREFGMRLRYAFGSR